MYSRQRHTRGSDSNVLTAVTVRDLQVQVSQAGRVRALPRNPRWDAIQGGTA